MQVCLYECLCVYTSAIKIAEVGMVVQSTNKDSREITDKVHPYSFSNNRVSMKNFVCTENIARDAN